MIVEYLNGSNVHQRLAVELPLDEVEALAAFAALLEPAPGQDTIESPLVSGLRRIAREARLSGLQIHALADQRVMREAGEA